MGCTPSWSLQWTQVSFLSLWGLSQTRGWKPYNLIFSWFRELDVGSLLQGPSHIQAIFSM